MFSCEEEVNAMGCREWGNELTDWALDELSPARARELEQHLERCQECAHAAQRLLGVRQALKSSLIDRDMPAHVVVFGDKAQSRFAGFWAALLRTAALSAAGGGDLPSDRIGRFPFRGPRGCFPLAPGPSRR